ncbi:MAG: ABC transporter ATP-binding protein/permease, partial [Succinivibrio sp.]
MFKTAIFKEESDALALRQKYHGADSLPLKVSVRSAARMIKLYWTSKDSLFSWFLLSLIIALTSGAIYLAKVFNSWYKSFWDTIQEYNLPGFKYQLMMFAILATIHVVVSVYNSYLRSMLSIRWRQWFTKKVMHDYLDADTYYKMQLEDRKTENPDQRISEDLGNFVSMTISLLLGTASDLAMLGTFGVVLWDLSHAVDMDLWGWHVHLPDGYMLYLAFAYAFIGTILTFIIGKPLVKLNFRQQRYEADFRFSLIRIRENSESISLYRGQKSEEEILKVSFVEVVKNYVKLIAKEKRLGFFTLGYAQTAVIFPMLIAAPMYFAKVITIGSIMQISSAFGRVQDSLSTVISSFSQWASYKAVVDRLALFFDSMDSSNEIACLKPREQGNSFNTQKVEVTSPSGILLWKDLDLQLPLGSSLLIRGPSGCGKSTLIKTMAGIWPHAKGDICVPEGSKSLFLSQRPYLPLGTLRQAVYYPDSQRNDSLAEHYLNLLGLSYLIESLDRTDNWSN